jgi:LETM1 and EF-hand domain-containing protein 1
MPKTMPAIAILIPRRAASTETSTSSNTSGNFPPPGFSTEHAKKPLPKDGQKAQEKGGLPDVSIPQDEPTSSPKTKAQEARTLAELASEKAASDAKEEKKVLAKKEEQKKLTVWQKVKHEAAHYWDGTKLLVAEVKISSKLALKMAAGYELTRREQRQVWQLRTPLRSHRLTHHS